MYQQFEVTEDGIEYMEIASHTVESHKKLCSDLGIFDQYEDRLQESGSSKGGNSGNESEDHLLSRYMNSASRTQAIICIEEAQCTAIQDEILSQLNDSEVHLIDIAAGHGAGTLSLLNTICAMRASKILKNNALDVKIHALDFSKTSLEYYREILGSLIEVYANQGIKVELYTRVVDITDDTQVNNVISEIKEKVGRNPRYLLICSAISGVKEKVFREQFSISYETISTRFKSDNSSFLWIEPRTKKAWMPKYWQDFYEKIGINPDIEERIAPHIVQQPFTWIDPYNKRKMGDSCADYFLMKLA